MKKNMGFLDRRIRLFAALIMIALFLTGTVTGVLGYVLLAVSAVFAGTSMVGSCPLYTIFGLTSCPRP